jgi:hypothetical protein
MKEGVQLVVGVVVIAVLVAVVAFAADLVVRGIRFSVRQGSML